MCLRWWKFQVLGSLHEDFLEDFMEVAHKVFKNLNHEHKNYQSLWYVCQVQSKLIFVVEWSLTPSVIVLFMVYFVIYMCTLLVVDYFVNLKRC